MNVTGQRAAILDTLRTAGGKIESPDGNTAAAIASRVESITGRNGVDRVTELLRSLETDGLVTRTISGRRTYGAAITHKGTTAVLVLPQTGADGPTPQPVVPRPPAMLGHPAGYYVVRHDDALHSVSHQYVNAHRDTEILEGPMTAPLARARREQLAGLALLAERRHDPAADLARQIGRLGPTDRDILSDLVGRLTRIPNRLGSRL